VNRLLLALAACTFLVNACSEVAFVDAITIVNDTIYAANVSVTDENRNGWLGLSKVGPESTHSAEEVIDQGAVWVFRFDFAGRYEEEVEVSRRDLRSNGWSVSVPESFEQHLRELDVPPTP
jgi:hypothetical protein